MILNENKVNRNHLWLYHRTRADLSMSEIWEKGLDNSKNYRAQHGLGLYATYEYRDDGKYGKNILRGTADISNFAIYEKDIYDQVQNHEDGSKTFEEHFGKLTEGFDMSGYTIGEDTSELADSFYNDNISDGYDGLIFKGPKDGKVGVVWTESKFTPHSYVETRKTATPKLGKSNVKDGVWVGPSEYKGTSLDLRNTGIESLGNLKSVSWNLILGQTKITSLGELESVGHNLHIGGTTITSLGKLKSVGGEIYTDKGTFNSIEEFNKAYGQNVQESISPFEHLCNMIDDISR